MATYQMGPDTFAVPMALFRDNRIRVAKALKEAHPSLDDKSYVVVQGGVDIPFNDTDVDHLFRQVRANKSYQIKIIEFFFLGIFLSILVWSQRTWLLWSCSSW